MNELDELKLQWSQTSLRVSQLEKDNARLTTELRQSKLQPSLQRLASTYRSMTIWECIMLAVTYPFFYLVWANLFDISVTWLVVFWVCIFLIAAIDDLWLYRHVKRIDVATMTVDEVSRRASQCRRVHLCIQALLIPILIGFIWELYIEIPDGRTGMLIGGIIGGAFGLAKWLQIMRSYKALIAQ